MLKEEIEDSAPVCGFSIPFMLLCYCATVSLSKIVFPCIVLTPFEP